MRKVFTFIFLVLVVSLSLPIFVYAASINSVVNDNIDFVTVSPISQDTLILGNGNSVLMWGSYGSPNVYHSAGYIKDNSYTFMIFSSVPLTGTYYVNGSFLNRSSSSVSGFNHNLFFVSSSFPFTLGDFKINMNIPIFSTSVAYEDYVYRNILDSSALLNPGFDSFLSSSFDGSISVDGFTVRNTNRYIDDLIYNISFTSDFVSKFTSSILNEIIDIKLNYYYDLQVPSYSWLLSQEQLINDNYGGSFDSWYSANSSFSQLLVCNSYVSTVINPHDHTLSKDSHYFGIDTNISSFSSDIYGVALTDTQQKLFDVCTYVRTVGVRVRWLLSALFGYGPLHIINIGPTLLNGRAINTYSFNGSSSTDGINDYFFNQDNIPDIDFNLNDNVVSSDNFTTIYYPNQNVITNNYNVYNSYLNYYPTVSSPGIQNVYVVNYKDFSSSDIFNNYDFDFDVDLIDSANNLISLGAIFNDVSAGDLDLIKDDSPSKAIFIDIFNGLPIEIISLFGTMFILLVVVGVINRLLG